MPTYPYACTACGHAFEVQQSFSDPSLTECPECSGRLRKVFSSVGVVFKGSGFYRTDSRKGSSGSTGAATGAGSADGGSTPGSGSPATKTSDSSAGASTGSSSSSSAKPAASSAPAASS